MWTPSSQQVVGAFTPGGYAPRGTGLTLVAEGPETEVTLSILSSTTYIKVYKKNGV